MFQKRHYYKMAEELKRSNLRLGQRVIIARFLQAAFSRDNPLFNEDTFFDACFDPIEIGDYYANEDEVLETDEHSRS